MRRLGRPLRGAGPGCGRPYGDVSARGIGLPAPFPELEFAAEAPPPARAVPRRAWRPSQRVVPRALAQYGEVRELELEVPVPAVWVGGKRMTLQLRLTLVPQEDEHGG